MVNYREIWGIMGNYGEIMGDYGELWEIVEKYGCNYGELWVLMAWCWNYALVLILDGLLSFPMACFCFLPGCY